MIFRKPNTRCKISMAIDLFEKFAYTKQTQNSLSPNLRKQQLVIKQTKKVLGWNICGVIFSVNILSMTRISRAEESSWLLQILVAFGCCKYCWHTYK